MSRRSVTKQNILDKFNCSEVNINIINGLDRELKRISKDRWKLKEAKRIRRKRSR